MICRCRNDRCTCIVTSGFGVNVSGNGTARNPYIADSSDWDLIGSNDGSTIVTVLGQGTVGDPYVVQIETDGQSVTRTVFVNNGDWINPGAGSVAHVICIGAGAGGTRAIYSDIPVGYPGGGGGAVSTGWFLLEDLPSIVPVVVGAGGLGGNFSGSANNYTWGLAGGSSYFGELLLAQGGNGTHPSSGRPAAQGGQISTAPEGGPGGTGAIGTTPAQAMPNSLGAGGGGVGQGNTYPGTPGEKSQVTAILVGKGGDGWPGIAGQDGRPGGLYGATSAPAFGAGGDGAPGIVIVTTW
jgi:hypothetical protein